MVATAQLSPVLKCAERWLATEEQGRRVGRNACDALNTNNLGPRRQRSGRQRGPMKLLWIVMSSRVYGNRVNHVVQVSLPLPAEALLGASFGGVCRSEITTVG